MRSFDDVIFYEQIFPSEVCKRINEIARSGENWAIQASNQNSENLFWMMKLNDDPFFTKHCFDLIKHIIGDNFKINKVYFNAQAAGQAGDPHFDSDYENDYTFLYYVNTEWDVKWGGHTSFINAYFDMKSSQVKRFADDAKRIRTISFIPVPNCALFFPSNIFHFAHGPDRELKGMRFTLAYKLTKEK